jgi:hypothetical protein
MRQVGDQQPVSRPEIEEETLPVGAAAAVAPATAGPTLPEEPAVVSEPAPAVREASATPTTVEPAPAGAAAASMPAEEPKEEPREEEDVSLEAILEDLKRREGRSE